MTGADKPNDKEKVRQQNDEALAKACINAGIGTRYHKMTLSDVPGGDKVFKLYEDKSLYRMVQQGAGMAFCQSGRGDSRSLAIMTARALLMNGVSCVVVNLQDLATMMNAIRGSRDDDLFTSIEPLYDCSYLTILGFYEAGYKECPLSPREVHQVSSLIAHRSDNGKSTSVHTPCGNSSMTFNQWWPDATVSLMNLLTVESV